MADEDTPIGPKWTMWRRTMLATGILNLALALVFTGPVWMVVSVVVGIGAIAGAFLLPGPVYYAALLKAREDRALKAREDRALTEGDE